MNYIRSTSREISPRARAKSLTGRSSPYVSTLPSVVLEPPPLSPSQVDVRRRRQAGRELGALSSAGEEQASAWRPRSPSPFS